MRSEILKIKGIFFLLSITALSFIGCNEIYDGKEFLVYEQEEPERPPLPEIPELGKKGIGYPGRGADWSSKVSQSKSHWHYTWGANLSIKEPENIDFVPMTWGKWDSDETFEELKALKEAGKIKYLLGFNEPESESQANMTVEEAIAIWPKLEEIGVPLGSPAVVSIDNEWLEEFMNQVEANGLRVDFMCAHKYGGLSPNGLLNSLEEFYSKYNRPIWLTEFAVGDWDATTVEEHKYTAAQVVDYMKVVLPELESRSYIHRYAWFPSSQTSPPLVSSSLWDENGNLTIVGEYYANFKPNTIIGPGRDHIQDIDDNFANNVVEDGDFEKGDLSIAWPEAWGTKLGGGYKGDYSIHCFESWGSGFEQRISVEPGKTYIVSVAAKWLGEMGGPDWFIGAEISFTNGLAKPDNVTYHLTEAISAQEWTVVNEQFTVPEGVTEMVVGFWRPGNTAHCLIDNILVAPID